MMKKILAAGIMLTTSGCASMNTPSSSLMDIVPVIKVAESKQVTGDHIVFIPANHEFPVEFSVKGTIFSQDVSSKVMASFKEDMYLYKYWASMDGRKWVLSHELMNVKQSGGFDKSGGKVEVRLDLVQ